jgi:cellulose biosynthesis protein BcsQ
MEEDGGHITTFYSYKGGTGRSMALANFAWIMAANGKRVLAIDWDLEAPGLHRYFRPFLVDPDLFETDGLIDTFWSFAASAMERAPSGKNAAPDYGADVVEALDDATRRLDSKFFSTGGYIDFIGAGRQGGTYSERVNSFDWKRFYELGGAKVLTAAKAHLRKRYDWVLIDSRTGVSDTSGICTIQMPKTVVAYFTLNRQSIDGVTAILRSIRAFRSASVDGSKIKFFPIATRIENAEQVRLEVARGYARHSLAEFLPKVMQSRPREYWDQMEITYRPAYAFEEVLAAFGDATGAAGAADTMLSQVEATAQRITGDEKLRIPEIVEADRAEVLAKYAFAAQRSSATRDAQTADDTDFLRGVRAKEQLWRTSKFQWRHLLSRRELDKLTEEDRKGFGRNMTFYLIQSERMQRLFRTAQQVGSSAFVLAFVVFIIFILFSPEMRSSLVSEPALGKLGVFVILVIGGSIFSVLARSIVAVVQDKPDGIRPLQLLIISLYGPFRPEIRDYHPDEERTP